MTVFTVCSDPKLTWTSVIVSAVFLSFITAPAVAEVCVIAPPAPQTFNETDSPGLALLEVSAGGPTARWSFQIESPSTLLEPCFRLEQSQGNATLILNKTVDLEEVYDILQGEFAIKFAITCTNLGVPVNYEFYASMIPVNEFEPEFVSLPDGGFNISESARLGEPVLVLEDYVLDKDVVPNHLGFDFRLLPTDDATVDGRVKFDISDSLTGTLVLINVLDYETMDPSKAFYYLRVSVGDREGMTSTGTVRINVIDADDQPPEFFYPECPSPCFTSYSAAIEDSFQGQITWLDPAPIAGRDLDTLDSPVTYSFKKGDPADYAEYLSIDRQTGVPSVIKAVTESDAAVFFVIVEAVEDTTLRHSEQTTLWLKVIGRNYTGPTPPPVIVDAFAGSEKAFRIATIVLGVLFGLVLLLLVFFVVCSMNGKVRAIPVLPRAIGKLSTDAGSVQNISSISNSGEMIGEAEVSRRSFTLRKSPGDSGVDLIRSLSRPTSSSSAQPALRSFSSILERDPDVEHLAGTTEIDYNQNDPDQHRRSKISTVSGSEVVPYEDQLGLVGSAEGIGVSSSDLGEETVGISNPVYNDLDEGGGDYSVDVSVIPMEQAHITI